MISAKTKRLIRSIYVMRCGYCGVMEAEAGAELTYDHFQPQSAGGSDDKENLVYACHACNEFKGGYYGETEATRLLHPLRDDISEHVRQEPDGKLQEVTPAGECYIRVLNLNRVPLLSHRRNTQRQEIAADTSRTIDARLDTIMARIGRIEERLRSRR